MHYSSFWIFVMWANWMGGRHVKKCACLTCQYRIACCWREWHGWLQVWNNQCILVNWFLDRLSWSLNWKCWYFVDYCHHSSESGYLQSKNGLNALVFSSVSGADSGSPIVRNQTRDFFVTCCKRRIHCDGREKCSHPRSCCVSYFISLWDQLSDYFLWENFLFQRPMYKQVKFHCVSLYLVGGSLTT